MKQICMLTMHMLSLIKRGFILFLIVSFTVFSLPAHAEEEHQMSKTDQIDQFVKSAMSRLHIPGAAVGIVKGNQTVFLKGYGIASPDRTPVTPRTSFVLGSTTKSFTALAVMQLVETGMIDLNAPVQQYLPWFKLADEEASKAIRVRDLLYQTSGLSEYDGRAGIVNGDKSIKDHLKDLHRVSVVSAVGSTYQYSNLNYNILSGIIEAVSRESYTDYIRKHIFGPLNMKTSFTSPAEAGQSLATGYQSVFGLVTPTKQLVHTGTVASGYLISSAEDLTHYMIAQMNQGRYLGTSILAPGGIQQMHEPAAAMDGGAFYGMGWSIKNGVTFHTGVTENTYSVLAMDGDYGIIVLANAIDYLVPYDNLVNGISRILRGQLPSEDSIPSFSRNYLIADVVLLLVLAFIAWSITSLTRGRTKYRTSRLWLSVNTGILIVFHLLIPLAILVLVPRVFSAPWSVVQLFLPGLGHALFYLPMLLIALGLLKAVLMVRRWSLAKSRGTPDINS